MSFTIPNLGDAGFPDQAEPDSQDFRAITDASALTGVVSGAQVAAQGSPDMTVAVAAGNILVAGVPKSVSSGNVTITAADGTNPRFDLIVADSTGAKQRRGGAAAANPVFPTPSAGDVVLAAVYVPASDTTINSNQIVDKRVSVPGVYRCSVTSAQSTSITGATFTKINFDTIAREDGPASFSLTNDEFTAPYAGWYSVDGNFSQSNAVTVRTFATIYKNGAGAKRGSDTNGFGSHVSGKVYLAASDTLSLYAWVATTAAQEADPVTNYLDIAYLGA